MEMSREPDVFDDVSRLLSAMTTGVS
jgi:hypothetical protein